MRQKLVDAILFQAFWWTIVVSALNGLYLSVLLAPIAFWLFHYLLVSRDLAGDLLFSGLIAVIGVILDFAIYKLELIRFYPDDFFLPPWLVALWLIFPVTLRYSLRGLAARPWWAGVVGFVFGPLTYFIGERFHLVEFNQPVALSLLAVALVWGLSLPGYFWIGKDL